MTFTVTNRPGYFAEVLDSWLRAISWADMNLNMPHPSLHFSLEPTPAMDENIWLISKTFGRSRAKIWKNAKIAGPLTNPFLALTRAFNAGRPPFVILAEDDAVVAEDILGYFDWASRSENSVGALTACAFQDRTFNELTPYDKPRICPPEYQRAVELSSRFTPTVWGTWLSTWREVLSPSWDHTYARRGWDWDINERHIPKDGWRVLKPMVSRSQHIGKHGGAHMIPDDFEAAQSAVFAADILLQTPTDQWHLLEGLQR